MTDLILYSANTWLAFSINERYYGGKHYVWCTPHFDRDNAGIATNVPPSSSPSDICRVLNADIQRNDLHSAAIERNRVGILKGASAKRASGVISPDQERDIVSILARAQLRDFRPMLYVIPWALITTRAIDVPIGERAHPLSVEYRIADLDRSEFDAIPLYASAGLA